jgi:hypothetical protein
MQDDVAASENEERDEKVKETAQPHKKKADTEIEDFRFECLPEECMCLPTLNRFRDKVDFMHCLTV